MLRLVTKLAIFPSLSHVMSCSVALRVGRSLSLCSGTMGNIWSIAQASGNDWKSEKLQKYLSANSLSRPFSSSGTCLKLFDIELISRHTLQYIRSISARVLRSTRPCSNRSRASSRICSASCQSSNIVRGLRLSQMSYRSFTSLCEFSLGSYSSGISGSDAVSSTSITSTEWCADSERPLSVMRLGCGMPLRSAASTKV